MTKPPKQKQTNEQNNVERTRKVKISESEFLATGEGCANDQTKSRLWRENLSVDPKFYVRSTKSGTETGMRLYNNYTKHEHNYRPEHATNTVE